MATAQKLINTLSQEEIDLIVTMYRDENKSLREIERITRHGRPALTRLLEELNVKTTTGNHYRKYFFNFDFFETIDSELKAYWLGFLYADGSIESSPPHGYGERAFKLALAQQDQEILEHFKKDLNSTYPIRQDTSRNNKNPNHQIQVIQSLRSEKTVQDLIALGCIPKKSLVLTFPTVKQVPVHLIPHFIRGYFDGDGSISYNKHQNAYHISFVGTESFIKDLHKYLPYGSIAQDKRKTNSWYLNIGGNLQVIKVYHYLYDNAERYMKRKYDKFQELLIKYGESQGIKE